MDIEENREHLEMIRKALDLIDDRVFEIINSVKLGAPGQALAVLDRCKVLSMVIACSP
jgi:hypothetical protein